MKTVTVTLANTNYNLLTLMQAVEAACYPRSARLQIQLDAGAGAAKLFVGNEDVSATNYGAVLLAGQAFIFDATPQSLVSIIGISLRSDTAGVKVNISSLVQ